MNSITPVIEALPNVISMSDSDRKRLRRYLGIIVKRAVDDDAEDLVALQPRIPNEHQYPALAERVAILEQKKTLGVAQLERLQKQIKKQESDRLHFESEHNAIEARLKQLKLKPFPSGVEKNKHIEEGIPAYLLPIHMQPNSFDNRAFEETSRVVRKKHLNSLNGIRLM